MNDITIKQDVVIIHDPLLALVIEAAYHIEPFDSFTPKENSKVTAYLYQANEWLYEAINDYKSGQLGTSLTAAELLEYRDRISVVN